MSTSAPPLPVQGVLLLQGLGQVPRRVELDGCPFRIGRSSASELAFPENAELSREHFVLEKAGAQWTIQDLNSRNGTLVNGVRIHGRTPLSNGDVILAGHLSFRFLNEVAGPATLLKVSSDAPGASRGAHTRSTDLKSALASEASTEVPGHGRSHLRAFVRAGRELISQRPMAELFGVILDIAVEAAGAARGVVAVQDGKVLTICAQRGTGFHLSTAIVEQVMVAKKSLLIVDIAGEVQLANRESIVAGQVKSVIAVPLQTEERVIGLLYVDTPSKVFAFTPEDLNLLTVLANVAAVRIEHARLVEVEQQEKVWARDREQAAEIQRSLLPCEAPALAGYSLAGYNAASRSVGGDYYDFLGLEDGRMIVVVADVAGKGMPAALLMSGLQARVHVLFDSGEDLAIQVAKLNRSLIKRFPSNRFVTFFVGALSAESGEIRFCNAGHNPPILLHADGTEEQLGATGPILGISAAFAYEERSVRMMRGDVLALYSDGVTEACEPTGDEEFGEERLIRTLRANCGRSAAAMVDATVNEIAQFAAHAPLADDLTLVILKRD